MHYTKLIASAFKSVSLLGRELRINVCHVIEDHLVGCLAMQHNVMECHEVECHVVEFM